MEEGEWVGERSQARSHTQDTTWTGPPPPLCVPDTRTWLMYPSLVGGNVICSSSVGSSVDRCRPSIARSAIAGSCAMTLSCSASRGIELASSPCENLVLPRDSSTSGLGPPNKPLPLPCSRCCGSPSREERGRFGSSRLVSSSGPSS